MLDFSEQIYTSEPLSNDFRTHDLKETTTASQSSLGPNKKTLIKKPSLLP